MTTNKLACPDGEIQFIATGTMYPGFLYQWGEQVVFIDGVQSFASGDLANGCNKGTFRWDTPSAQVFALDGVAWYDPSDNMMYAATDTGRFIAGKVRKAKSSGTTEVLVELNAHLGTSSYIQDASQQSLSGAGAINVTSYYTKWTTTGAQAGTLADGSIVGQLKKIQLIVDGGDGTLTPANFSVGTTITFADAGDYVVLRWTGTDWKLIESGNDADGATAPVVA